MLKIMSLDLNGYDNPTAPWPVRQGLVREMILDAVPDVVALQGVEKDPSLYDGVDQADQLGGLLPEYKTVIFRPALFANSGVTEGLAFLGRIEIEYTDHLPIREILGEAHVYPRLVLHACFSFPHTQFHLYNVFFPRDPLHSLQNLRDLMTFIKLYSGPALLLGDLNMNPDDEALRLLKEEGWIDLWPEFYPEENGMTYYEAGQPVGRFDYAWANPELRPYVEGMKILNGTQEETNVKSADHAGLLVSLNLQTQANQ
ncbi:MAG: endonuclease/exonuclease/phosphatase family protein [Chloroflexi bacterium]|nr:endonuclease/exonuclease/phosphatase family protein [Chloroflexota bacterium]